MVTFEVTDHVRETIQQTLYRLQANRRSPFGHPQGDVRAAADR
jgi:hypothetical protein